MPVKIDSAGCTGCGACVLSCPQDVLRLDDTQHKAVITYLRDCSSCRECLLHCPFHCIDVVNRPRKVAENFTMKQYLIGLGIDPKQALSGSKK